MNQLDFNGRHAVITGGATGLGCAIAARLLASGGVVTYWGAPPLNTLPVTLKGPLT